MHVVFNGWFWDQPNTGSGQYLRNLLPNLRKIAPELQMTLALPPGVPTPDDLPPDVRAVPSAGSRSNLGKVWFEQRTFPKIAGRVGADIAHVPYWGPPLSSPIRLVTSVLDVIPLALPEYSGARLIAHPHAQRRRQSRHREIPRPARSQHHHHLSGRRRRLSPPHGRGTRRGGEGKV
jgi:hypothetical protein